MDVIAALAGAATMPFPAGAQQQARIRRIGMFLGIAEHDPEAQVRLGAMLDELQRLGWTSANLDLVHRWSGDDAERVRAYAEELVSLAPDLEYLMGTLRSVAPAVGCRADRRFLERRR
jgi:hypothetical protein